MATFLFDKIIFGPVKSRRLGVSLGINLLPTDIKVCSFDCVYCECGRNPKKYETKVTLPTRDKVGEKLEATLIKMVAEKQLPDVITFAGNGEPTLHPDFAGIIDDTIKLCKKYTPKARVAVLSNATMLHKKAVFNALLKIEDNIQKLDSAFEQTIKLMDCPNESFDLEKVVNQLAAFNGKVIIQTMFVRGTIDGTEIDNTTQKEIMAWIKLLQKIKPAQVMIYTIARDTPIDTLEKISLDQLNSIAKQVRDSGFDVQVSG
jgi:wyosine [tRNA(Phe)-imidazoG37] synthetase (radical SAM superfamily)